MMKLITLRKAVSQGFPKHKHQLDEELRPLWTGRNKLSRLGEVVLYGTRVVIPAEMRKEVLDGLHPSHQGKERTLNPARQCVFSLRITAAIYDKVERCLDCQEFKESNQKEPLIQDQRPVVTDKLSG